METKKIGTNSTNGYPELRNFINLPYNYTFIQERDLFNTLLNVYFKLTKKIHPFFQFLHLDIGLGKTKLKHYFNTISLSNKPWIITFETTLPRLGNAPKIFYNIAVKKLASKHCKKIIAISECTYNLQIKYLKKNYPNYLDTIKEKMIILHPPQDVLINNYEDKNLANNKIIFTIIGGDFFRKGGREILNVFDKLIPINGELHLNIVSSMFYGDYASQTTKEDYQKAIEIINKFPNNITHYKQLPNNKVLELLKNSHVGLLPTWGETYGYSVLESQATACPVITTNLRALPEINNNKIGWLIKVPKLSNGNGDISTFEKRKSFQEIIETELKQIIIEIINNKESIKEKGLKALESIKIKHNKKDNAKVLSEIYLK